MLPLVELRRRHDLAVTTERRTRTVSQNTGATKTHSEQLGLGRRRRCTAYARERCVQIELAPRNAGTDSRDRHGETEKRQRRAHARHAYCSEPSQSRSRPLSVAPATCSVAHRASLASDLSPSHAARPRRAAPRRTPSRRPARRPARFIENPYLRFFLTSIAYIRGSQTSRRNHVAFFLLRPTRI